VAEPGHTEASCSGLTSVFALLGKRWSGLIVGTLMDGPARFSEMVRQVPGVSERMLSDRLTELVAANLIERAVDSGPPVSVWYQLTPRGEALRPALRALEQWADEYLPTGGEPGPTDAPGEKLDRAAPARSRTTLRADASSRRDRTAGRAT